MALRRLEHVLVLTDDLETSKSFYCEALGLEVGERPPLEFPGYWLYVDGVPCLHLAERAAYEAHAATLGLAVGPAVDHLAFGGADFDDAAERLEAAGFEATANEVSQAGLRQLFVTDPNGVRIELNF